MSNIILFSFIVCVIVVIVMVKQINKITQNIDSQSIENNPNVYANFSAFIQEKVRAIKADIDHTKNVPNPTFILLHEEDEDSSLEFLADSIRKLVFLETMNAKRKSPKEVENELFKLLSSIDDFLTSKIKNGQELADNLRDEFSEQFNKLQNNNL